MYTYFIVDLEIGHTNDELPVWMLHIYNVINVYMQLQCIAREQTSI